MLLLMYMPFAFHKNHGLIITTATHKGPKKVGDSKGAGLTKASNVAADSTVNFAALGHVQNNSLLPGNASSELIR